MNRHLKIAIPRGPYEPQLREQFGAAGFPIPEGRDQHRLEATFEDESWTVDIIRIATADMGTYVERGAVQVGVMSTDAIHELNVDVWRPYTFACGAAPIILAARRDQTLARLHSLPHLRLATAIPRFTREWFSTRGFNVEIVHVHDDHLRAVQMGLADGLVSLLHDPNPLLNNDFRALEQLGISELKLVVNNAISSYRRKFIRHIMDQLEAHRPPASPPVQIPYDTEDPE